MTAGVVDVGRKKGDKSTEASTEKPLTTVKMRTDIHRKLRTLASFHDEDLADYLDIVLRPVIERLWNRLHSQLGEETQGGE